MKGPAAGRNEGPFEEPQTRDQNAFQRRPDGIFHRRLGGPLMGSRFVESRTRRAISTLNLQRLVAVKEEQATFAGIQTNVRFDEATPTALPGRLAGKLTPFSVNFFCLPAGTNEAKKKSTRSDAWRSSSSVDTPIEQMCLPGISQTTLTMQRE